MSAKQWEGRRWHRRPLAIPSLERGTLADRAADAIRLRILRGMVVPGQRLESLRDLASDLRVSVSVVREAVARLKGEGALEVHPGRGTFVARRSHAARMAKAVRMRATRTEVAELRAVTEPAIARFAARRATHRDVTELFGALGELAVARVGGDPDAFTKADLAFHLAIAKASRNGVGIGLHRMGTNVLASRLSAKAQEHALNHELEGLHQTLFEAIETGRSALAERAARRIAAIEARPP